LTERNLYKYYIQVLPTSCIYKVVYIDCTHYTDNTCIKHLYRPIQIEHDYHFMRPKSGAVLRKFLNHRRYPLH